MYELLSFKYMLELISTSWIFKPRGLTYPESDQRAYTYCYWRDSAEAHWQTDV